MRLGGHLRELKNKGKVQLGRELFITKFKSQFKRGFTKVVVTRAGRLREWSQRELRLYTWYSFNVIQSIDLGQFHTVYCPPTPPPKPTLTLTSHLEKCWLREG